MLSQPVAIPWSGGLHHAEQLETLSHVGAWLRSDLADCEAPYASGRVQEGDLRSSALKAAQATLIAVADDFASQAAAELTAYNQAEAKKGATA